MVSRTQPSGPLCLWQCLSIKLLKALGKPNFQLVMLKTPYFQLMIVKNLIISCHGSDSKMTKKDPCLLIIQGRLVMPENEGLRVKGEGFPGLDVNKKEGHCISHRACWKHFYLTDSLPKHIKAAKFYQIMSVIHGQHRPLNMFIG